MVAVMFKTNDPAFTLPKYKKGHDLKRAQEVPGCEVPRTFTAHPPDKLAPLDPKPVPVEEWTNWPRNYGVDKCTEFGVDVVKFMVTWPTGESAWWTVDRGSYHKVW